MTSDAIAPGTADLERRTYVLCLIAVAVLAAALRLVFPLADPPWLSPVGVVWHDEGAWTHNARNVVLFGVWQMDQWNPMYLTPVFTGLEALCFRIAGVGLWQARIGPELLGLCSVLLFAGAIRRTANRRAGLFAGALLASSYVWVQWNRAALLEGPMVCLMVASAWSYVRAQRTPAWGLLAGAFALLAFFAKAAAAFFLAALAFEALVAFWLDWQSARESQAPLATAARRAGFFTLAGLAAAGVIALVIFVIPHWSEFRFYNWQMSVTRKPAYTIKALIDRASWLPVLHGFFTRMWIVLVLAAAALVNTVARWRRTTPLERLCALWIVLGVTELILHDVGNERRLVFLIPPLAAFAAIALGRDRRWIAPEVSALRQKTVWLAAPVLAYLLYVVCGGAVRVLFPGLISPVVRISAVAACVLTAGIALAWRQVAPRLQAVAWSATTAGAVVAVLVCLDLAQFAQWASTRTYYNYDAMITVRDMLPPGTLVHGKLANGLDLESRIRPVFVGHGFGNFDDRLLRPDIRYLLTYTRPEWGYEGSQIKEVLAAHTWRVVRRFPVAESRGAPDEAALLEKVDPQPGR